MPSRAERQAVMKKTTTKPALGIVKKSESERGTLPDAYGMAIIGRELAKQLRGIARTITSAKGATSRNAETERKDLLATIGLFADNLGRIEDLVDEVMIILEAIEPTLTAVNE